VLEGGCDEQVVDQRGRLLRARARLAVASNDDAQRSDAAGKRPDHGIAAAADRDGVAQVQGRCAGEGEAWGAKAMEGDIKGEV